MENLKIGNWLITADGIEWDGKAYKGYYIDKDRLLQRGLEHKDTYDWLLHMAHKNWLTETDIYALNTALVYAMEYFNAPNKWPKLSFVKSINEQQKIIHYKNALPNKGLIPLKALGIDNTEAA
ncbi:MAG TPA: hypothetical protein VGM63_23275 [Mucilaginibacter sp.]|jgi:hypothetical protein